LPKTDYDRKVRTHILILFFLSLCFDGRAQLILDVQQPKKVENKHPFFIQDVSLVQEEKKILGSVHSKNAKSATTISFEKGIQDGLKLVCKQLSSSYREANYPISIKINHVNLSRGLDFRDPSSYCFEMNMDFYVVQDDGLSYFHTEAGSIFYSPVAQSSDKLSKLIYKALDEVFDRVEAELSTIALDSLKVEDVEVLTTSAAKARIDKAVITQYGERTGVFSSFDAVCKGELDESIEMTAIRKHEGDAFELMVDKGSPYTNPFAVLIDGTFYVPFAGKYQRIDFSDIPTTELPLYFADKNLMLDRSVSYGLMGAWIGSMIDQSKEKSTIDVRYDSLVGTFKPLRTVIKNKVIRGDVIGIYHNLNSLTPSLIVQTPDTSITIKRGEYVLVPLKEFAHNRALDVVHPDGKSKRVVSNPIVGTNSTYLSVRCTNSKPKIEGIYKTEFTKLKGVEVYWPINTLD